MEFYWTLTRLLGLGSLHDGTKSKDAVDAAGFDEDDFVWPPKLNSLLAASSRGEQKTPRVLVDVTATGTSLSFSGIQRVVREFAKVAQEAGLALPVFVNEGRLFEAYSIDAEYRVIDVAPGDHLLLLDANWTGVEHYVGVVADIKRRGGKIIAFFYDTAPLTMPWVCSRETTEAYTQWFTAFTKVCDHIMCNTKAVAEEICHYLGPSPCRSIGWVPAATNAFVVTEEQSRRLAEIFERSEDVFLSVGTLEPRKGYPIALKAFETLWHDNSDAIYVIIGRYGWNMSWFADEIRAHPEFESRLIWLDDASDDELAYAYTHAKAMILPSIYEGFGLPVVEAARSNIPLLLSDIPVFREVASGHAAFFFRGR